MRSTRSLTSLSLSSSASHQMTWCGVRGVAAFQPPRPAAAGDRNPSSGVPRVRAMKNPARFPGPGLGALLNDIFLYMNPAQRPEVTSCTTQRLYSASQELPVPTLNRVLRGLVPSYSRPAHLLRSKGKSGSAECLAHPLVRLRWVHVTREVSLVVERLCEHQQKLLKRRKVFTLDRRLDHGLNSMIARYEGGIDRSHPGAAFVRRIGLLHEP